ncbi:MAG TPA: metal-dependent transcriptional regulator [Sedimentisphaerales bacterium]|nr:metal-dependent transcriptional regulator [Sedimentisphaerales bacterium]
MTQRFVDTLSASLEDYLEVILWAVAANGAARVRDIANRLHVQASSVTAALQVLAQRQLVHYKPYEAVTLTAEGFEEAARVIQRHHVLREFFTEVLGVDVEAAEEGACRLEHEISGDIARRLAGFMEYAKAMPQSDRAALSKSIERSMGGSAEADSPVGRSTVADMKPGRQAVIVRIGSHGELARRLADMGLGRGALVEVEAVAPLGDPIRIRIRGYRLALRKAEARSIAVIEK